MKCVHLGRAPWGDVPRLVPGAPRVPHPVVGPEEGEYTRLARSRAFNNHTWTRAGDRRKGLCEVDKIVWT